MFGHLQHKFWYSKDLFNVNFSLKHLIEGKLLLRHWLCNPCCVVSKIEIRQSAVEDLLKINDFVVETTKLMKQMPDLERLLQK